MAVRVRKLARELKTTPAVVLGVLHALGYVKYRTPEDMVADAAVVDLKRGIRKGVRPLPVDVAEPPVGGARRPAPAADVMGQLVPGVRRIPDPDVPQPVVPAVAPRPQPPEPHRADRGEADGREAELARRGAALAVREAELAALADELGRREAAVAEGEREAAAGSQPTAGSDANPTLADLLEARGLRGRDEMQRAVAALAATYQLGDAASRWRVDDPEALQKILLDRLVLVSGPPPDGLSHVALVSVAPDRAEVPDAEEVSRGIARVGELLLLHGLRRLRVVGGRPVWHRLLRGGLDPRVELVFQSPLPRDRAAAEEDVTRTDAVVLWRVQESSAASDVYDTSRALVVRVDGNGLVDLLEAVLAALDDSR